MKIVFLSRLYHPHIGGVEKHVENLSIALTKKKHEIAVITTQHENSLNLKDKINNISIWRIPREQTLTKLGIWDWMLKHKQDLEIADVVHAHDVNWWLIPIRPFINTPVYTTFHGWEGVFPPTKKAKIVRKLAEKTSQGNICVGDFISKWYQTNPDIVTYGATNQTPLEPGSKDRIVVLGRLSKDNDLSIVLKGLKRIKKRHPNIKIIFLGDGELAWEAEKLGKVLGFQDQPEKFIKQAHWVIASSYLSILDSIAAGRTVFSVYSNPLKKDYLTQHPAARFINIAVNDKTLADLFSDHYLNTSTHADAVNTAQNWALKQTWEKLADTYIKLWKNDIGVAAKELHESLED
jgi:glycosyltransferase involved in cell wall biosynthesis